MPGCGRWPPDLPAPVLALAVDSGDPLLFAGPFYRPDALDYEGLLARLPVISFDAVAARIHARLSAELAANGTAVGPHDLIIAATALTKGYIVTTRDERSFPRISGLSYRRG